MGYQTNRIARALIKGTTETIALVFPGNAHLAGNEYYGQIVTHAVEQLSKSNYDLKVHALYTDEDHSDISGSS